MSWCFKWVVEWDRKSYLGPAEIELASAKVLSIKQTAQTLSTEQGFLWNKMIFCVFWGGFFCVYHCERIFFYGEKLNVAKHLITYRILFIPHNRILAFDHN